MLNRYIFFLAASLVSAFLVVAYLPLKNGFVLPFQDKIAQKMIESTKTVHDECLAQIKAEFAISDETWNQFIGVFQETIKKDELLGSSVLDQNDADSALITMTKKLLIEHGIKLEKVAIALVESSSGSPALITQEFIDNKIKHTLKLNVRLMNAYEPLMQEALLRHEITHLLNYDSLEASFILGMLNHCGYESQKYDKSPAIIAYRHQRELRADALASCDRPEIAQALQSDFARYIHLEDQNNPALWLSHPSNQKRYDQMTHMLQDMGHTKETIA